MERLYYISHWLWKHHVPVAPRCIMLLIRIIYQSFIPYKAQIGPGIYFGHKMGIVINESARIGSRVRIMHAVTIAGGPATIEDDVHIGAGAKIIGRVRIGKGAKIGANAVVLKDVPPFVTAAGVPAKIVRRHIRPEIAQAADKGPAARRTRDYSTATRP